MKISHTNYILHKIVISLNAVKCCIKQQNQIYTCMYCCYIDDTEGLFEELVDSHEVWSPLPSSSDISLAADTTAAIGMPTSTLSIGSTAAVKIPTVTMNKGTTAVAGRESRWNFSSFLLQLE